MIAFTQPAYLWALTALAIPLAIHLLSRKEGRVIKIGSLRHVQETSTQQFRGIKLNELLLLALRSLLIVLFVFLLSGLHVKEQSNKNWLVVESGLQNNPIVKSKIDSLRLSGFEIHALQKNFPLLEEKTQTGVTDYWQLITELNAINLDSVIVLSATALKNFSGLRTAMPPFINWITVPVQEHTHIAYAWKQDEKIWLRQGYTEPEKTRYETRQNTAPDSIIIEKPAITVSIVSDAAHESEKKIIQAALNAIADALPVTIIVKKDITGTNASADWVFWLSDKKPVVADSLSLMISEPQTSTELIIQTHRNCWAITQPLTLDVARKEHLTVTLATILFPEERFVKNIQKQDLRVLPVSTLLAGKHTQKAGIVVTEHPPAIWLVILFLLTLMAERMVAYKRNQ